MSGDWGIWWCRCSGCNRAGCSGHHHGPKRVGTCKTEGIYYRRQINASIDIAKITGDVRADTAALQSLGTIDDVLDFSPPAAANSTHLRSALASLRRNGRCSAIDFTEQPSIDWKFVGNNFTVNDKLMYERDDIIHFVKVLERGLFPKGKAFVDTKTFGMEDWKLAFGTAVEHAGIRKLVVISLAMSGILSRATLYDEYSLSLSNNQNCDTPNNASHTGSCSTWKGKILCQILPRLQHSHDGPVISILHSRCVPISYAPLKLSRTVSGNPCNGSDCKANTSHI